MADVRAIRDDRYGPWEIAVLCLLREAPMHPYEIQRRLRERRKYDVLVLKRGSLYHAIHRLRRGRLIEILRHDRNGGRPERTTYRLTAAGERYLVEWLRRLVAAPRREASSFMTCLSFLIHLTPMQAAAELDRRAAQLDADLAALRARMREALPRVTRVHLLESEYLYAMRRAELAWVRRLGAALRSRRLSWRPKTLLARAHAATQGSRVAQTKTER